MKSFLFLDLGGFGLFGFCLFSFSDFGFDNGDWAVKGLLAVGLG